MKVAVVGAGFYGIRMAQMIKRNFNSSDVTIYEKNREPLREAVVNNQHRLHLGFHYPRCNETINQANSSFKTFLSEYPGCVDDIENNLYIVHNESKVSLDDYLKVFDNHNINYKVLNSFRNPILKGEENYEALVSTGEKKINLHKLSEALRISLIRHDITLKCNSKVMNISEDGVLETKNGKEQYDFIINCSYSNPNLIGEGIFDTKSELCFMCLLRPTTEFYHNFAFTVCDGPFSSLYPADDGCYTLSNVIKTPYYKSLNVDDLYEISKNLSEKQKLLICDEIIDESEKYFRIKDNFKVEGVYSAMKTKIINDVDDYRGSYYIKRNKTFNILSGKLQAAFLIEQDILREIRHA